MHHRRTARVGRPHVRAPTHSTWPHRRHRRTYAQPSTRPYESPDTQGNREFHLPAAVWVMSRRTNRDRSVTARPTRWLRAHAADRFGRRGRTLRRRRRGSVPGWAPHRGKGSRASPPRPVRTVRRPRPRSSGAAQIEGTPRRRRGLVRVTHRPLSRSRSVSVSSKSFGPFSSPCTHPCDQRAVRGVEPGE
jgi:hypothetical protein